ncbi:YwbE family protein [uncultured Draconibacterium sp.]|uniref:YwbE family protein n=1 Tax=uncultured Draconibacterium sp. TaxID=1573823 RepID=UPI0029C00468|nr:YwbE family protein [uncultured Draconibacterium sp.]
MNNQQRKNIKVGLNVAVVKKEHQQSGELTCGIVQKILTKSAIHPHGIKVMLESGEVGRVQKIMQES